MNFGICALSVVPVRSSASDKSEMVSQLLFGEMVEILEKKGTWAKVRCSWDNYIGWIDIKQVKIITPSEFKSYSENHSCSLELIQPAISDDYYLPIALGSNLPNYDGLRFSFNGSSFTFSGQVITPVEIEAQADLVLKIARRYLFAPYLWGGRSPLGIDCSGFTQVVFKMVGKNLPRDAYEQVEQGDLVDFIEESQDGDLAFFENRKGKISHVGILLPEGQIIHASGQVRIDKIDHYGIFNTEKEKYTHRLRVIKRILHLYSQKVVKSTDVEAIDKNQVGLF